MARRLHGSPPGVKPRIGPRPQFPGNSPAARSRDRESVASQAEEFHRKDAKGAKGIEDRRWWIVDENASPLSRDRESVVSQALPVAWASRPSPSPVRLAPAFPARPPENLTAKTPSPPRGSKMVDRLKMRIAPQ